MAQLSTTKHGDGGEGGAGILRKQIRRLDSILCTFRYTLGSQDCAQDSLLKVGWQLRGRTMEAQPVRPINLLAKFETLEK